MASDVGMHCLPMTIVVVVRRLYQYLAEFVYYCAFLCPVAPVCSTGSVSGLNVSEVGVIT